MGTPRRSGWLVLLVLTVLALVAPSAAIAAPPSRDATPHRLVTGLEGGSGSTVGPDGALYVTESAAGRITRVDPRTGATTTLRAVCRR
jgi:streptogramin lyase